MLALCVKLQSSFIFSQEVDNLLATAYGPSQNDSVLGTHGLEGQNNNPSCRFMLLVLYCPFVFGRSHPSHCIAYLSLSAPRDLCDAASYALSDWVLFHSRYFAVLVLYRVFIFSLVSRVLCL